MTKKAFVTGVSGQDGAYLAKLLIEKGYKVYGGVRRSSQNPATRLEQLGIYQGVEFVPFDLAEFNSIYRGIRDHPVDEFYNLAAQSFVHSSWELPVFTGDVNGLGVVRILDILRTLAPETRFYQASTSEMFGKIHETPQKETTPFHPRSPYGVSKVYAHMSTVNYRESYDMHACAGILFNHESPLRGTEFVTRKITLGLARLARNLTDNPVELGNLDAFRDWGFAGDYVEGMWMMLQREKPDDYILATGKMASIREFVQMAAEALDMSLEWSGTDLGEMAVDMITGKTVVSVNEAFYRPAEVEQLQGDCSKARDVLGWTHKVSLDRLASMMARSDYDALG